MKSETFVSHITSLGIHSFIGVPDSTLKEFCSYIRRADLDIRHLTPHNEGGAVGIAAGVYLSTGRPACVYMQNSGLGNIVNPVTSLMNDEVYGIPMLLIIGWRGEPGVHDEPQHKFMGKITLDLLKLLNIDYSVVDSSTTENDLNEIFGQVSKTLKKSKQYALVIKKNTFEPDEKPNYSNEYSLNREYVIGRIISRLRKDDVVVSTTGKISREVYEQSNKILGHHAQDFLTVGGMGHASMIAFGIASNLKNKRVVCVDGDGAVLMHMGSLAFIGREKPENYVHICLNNDAHESVGGMPTGAVGLNYADVAELCGYDEVFKVRDESGLEKTLNELKSLKGLIFIEIKVALGARADLGRPKESASENKDIFMQYHGVKI